MAMPPKSDRPAPSGPNSAGPDPGAPDTGVREPRARGYDGHPFLSAGFRPFFACAGLWAIMALALSLAMMLGRPALATAYDARAWHFHELLFGYLAAAVAGFLLTAIPNWTGRLPLRGGPLLGLVLVWCAGRFGMLAAAWLGPAAAALLDLAFLPALAAAALREILAGRNWRNLPIVLLVALLALANGLFHAEALGFADSGAAAFRLGLGTMLLLVALIGGRIIPSFTGNWLRKRGAAALPAGFGRFDRLTLIATLAALGLWAAVPQSGLLAGAAALAAALNLARWLRWRGHLSLAEPLLWVLHLAYLWIAVGFALLAAAAARAAPGLQEAAIHAWTVGALATMTLAVMSRAILGHTGRSVTAGPGLTAVFALITLAAAARLLAVLWPASYEALLYVSAAAWIGAFALFLALCGPILLRPKRPAGDDQGA